MALWKTIGGPREFRKTPDARDIDVGWAWDIERPDGERRLIRVYVAGGRAGMPGLPAEARRAISTRGRSAVESVLEREEPPAGFVVTSDGLRELSDS